MENEPPITKERKREIYDKSVENGGVEEIKKFNAKDVLKTDGISLAILFLLYVLQVRFYFLHRLCWFLKKL